MGLSRNIDLTEKGDFGSSQFDGFDSLILSNQEIEIYRMNDDKPMTNETYHRIRKYISLFGKRYHDNEFNIVFNKDGKFEKEIDEHCFCCGKPLRIPWDKNRGLCKECNKDYDKDYRYIYGKMPWGDYVMNDSRDILSLR